MAKLFLGLTTENIFGNLNEMVHSAKNSSIGYPFWQYWVDAQDARTADFPLVGSPYPLLSILGVYLYFCISLGPRLMRPHQPFDNLKPIMLFYNFSMAIFNAYFVFRAALCCEYGMRFIQWKLPDRNDRSLETMYELNTSWWYWMTKFLDLFDTVFFVLRKKQSHISFLHLYHHTSMPILVYLFLKHNAQVPATFLAVIINGTIHVIMYSYYGLSLLGPAVRAKLWWKKYITQLQIGQFVIAIVYSLLTVFKLENSGLTDGYCQVLMFVALSQVVIYLLMFCNFYRKSYTVSKKLK